jgi:predicted O-linked N-acetylglucosamine transferase (SPINDLY family)
MPSDILQKKCEEALLRIEKKNEEHREQTILSELNARVEGVVGIIPFFRKLFNIKCKWDREKIEQWIMKRKKKDKCGLVNYSFTYLDDYYDWDRRIIERLLKMAKEEKCEVYISFDDYKLIEG